MKLLIRIILFLLLPLYSLGQVNPLYIEPSKNQADSLRVALSKGMNDTLRMAAYRELALYYFDLNSDSSLFFVEKDLPLARSLGLKLWEADALDLMALSSSNQGNYVKSMKSFNAAVQIAESRDCEKNIWKIERFTTSKDPSFARLSMLATIQSDMSGLYRSTGNYDKQRRTVQDCFKTIALINDNTLYSQAYMVLGSIYFREKKLDSALYAYKRSLAYSDLSGYYKYKGSNYLNVGSIYMDKHLVKPAHESYMSAIQACIEQNNISGLGDTYIALANYFHILEQDDSSLHYARAGLKLSKTTNRIFSIIRSYNNLSAIHNSEGKPDSALLYLQMSVALKDSMFSIDKIRQLQNVGFDEQLRLQELEIGKIESQNRVRTYALVGGLGVVLAIGLILYRNNRQKQKANKVLETALNDLRATQSQLVQAEKMASLGELTAGIAHEIQNPLNFVNNFSEINRELIHEMKSEIDNGNLEEVKSIAATIEENEDKINHHGRRADAIVKGMLQHSRTGSSVKEPADINALADEYLRLAYHGLRARDKTFNAFLKTEFDSSIGNINIVPQELGRVILNLINNAFYAVNQRKNQKQSGYEPVVTISTKKLNNRIEIHVKDNGMGVPPKILDKIFQPFFTTKQTGQGTGLGLSLSYDIVKAHGGEIKVETKEGEGTDFTIVLPIN